MLPEVNFLKMISDSLHLSLAVLNVAMAECLTLVTVRP